ncbi:MAG: GNAT family N-acetyltransferase [Actinobacteria bacterium]|nr:GNAT family N-acetyltransferase [Actinomycetota bacterium]
MSYTVSETLTPPGYPTEFEADVVLSDGGTVHIRPIRPDDMEAIRTLHESLSDETIYMRFFTPHPTLSDAELEHFTHVDYVDRFALVAVLDDAIIAVARYDRLVGSTEAEAAFLVADAHQGRGIGTIMLEYLAAAARTRGVSKFIADTLPTNRKMLAVFTGAGFEETTTFADGVVSVSFPIQSTPASLAAARERDRIATRRSIMRLLRPSSIAVVGASRTPGTIGHEIFRNLLAGEFTGPVYPVNPVAKHVAGVRAYANIMDIPDEVDLAIITVPAALVAEVIEDCGKKKVGGLVVISAGFAETGPEGAAVERHLVRRAHIHGMRLVGPNCMGVINTSPDISMNATFAPDPPTRGRVGFSSQSGGLGIAILGEATGRGIGVSSFVSMGNKADVSGNDLLAYWEDDPDTDVILLYLESFGNPRVFSTLARRISRSKPIVTVKAGRTSAGTRGASSHTAALATPDVAVDALFKQAGVIRVDTLQELFDVAELLVNQPLPAGRRVAILGNAGGPGVLCSDACEGHGLEVPELSERTQNVLRTFLPEEAAVRNPVDMVASASADDYKKALEVLLADEVVDAVIVIFTPPLVTQAGDVAKAIAEVAAGAKKPVLANFLSAHGALEALRGTARSIPWYPYPELAAQALARVSAYAEWRRAPEGTVPTIEGIDKEGAAKLIAEELAHHPEGSWLAFPKVSQLLACYGISVVSTIRVSNVEEAEEAAQRIGYPVVLKVDSEEIVHKSDVGGVAVHLESPEELSQAYSEMTAKLGSAMEKAIVQHMVDGVEVIVGAVQDPSFGPLVMFGTGGVSVELLGDRAFSLLPLTDLDVHNLVRSTRGSPLLFGYRGSPPCDVDKLEEMIHRFGRMVEDMPELLEADLNPVMVSKDRVAVVDAKIRLGPPPVRADLEIRRLK